MSNRLVKLWIVTFILIYSTLIQNVMANDTSSSIHEIKTMKEVSRFADKDTLVIFDLDHTVFEGKSYGYGHANWFYDQIEEGNEKGLDKKELMDKFYPHWIHSQKNSHVKPVEEITPKEIKKLQAKGIQMIGVTSRQVSISDITLQQLKSIGVDFNSELLPKDPLTMNFKDSAALKNGVLFCSDHNDKGEVLHAYLNKLNIHPKKLLVVEDSLNNIKSIIKAYNKENTQVIGLHYPLVVEVKKYKWDGSKARQEYYTVYLKTDSLPPLFYENQKRIKQQDALLKKNAEIDEAYEFEMLGKKFVGLPGVFSPIVFGGNGSITKYIAVKKGMEVLEIGPATGYFAVLCALNGAKKVVAIDISPEAVKNTKMNAERHKVSHIVDARVGDIFNGVRNGEKFDVIYWDIPFNHTEKLQLNLLEQSIYDPNHLLLTRFIKEAKQYLKPDGVVYLIYSPSHSNLDFLFALAKHAGWEMQLIRQEGEVEHVQIALFAFRKLKG